MKFRLPWNQHYVDVGHCRFQKCITRIITATDSDIQLLPVSLLAMAIRASTAYSPKNKQDRALVRYAKALIARGIDPNDCDSTGCSKSAVQWAAYFGYLELLKVLLQAGCSIMAGGTHALQVAASNGQHEGVRLLLELRGEQCIELLQTEARQEERVGFRLSTFYRTLQRKDVRMVCMLRDEAKAKISGRDLFCHREVARWELLLQDVYPEGTNVLSWSKQLHWSFPTADRQMIN